MNEETRQDMNPEMGKPAHAGRTLGDLFDAARRDVRPSLLERTDAEDLIRNSETTVLHRLDLRHGWVRRNLLSSPIRIGVTLMTTSAFASLMAIAVSQFTGSAPIIPTQKPPTHAPLLYSQAAPSQHAEARLEVVPTAATAIIHSSEPAKPEQLPVKFGTAKLTDSDTLHAVELNPDQLARLGVELPDNGDIVVYYPNVKGKADSWRFTTRGQLSQAVGTLQNSNINLQPLPYAITYPRGEALLYSRFALPGQKPDVLIGMAPEVSHKYIARYAELRGETPSDQTSFGVATDVSEEGKEGHARTKVITQIQTNSPANGPAVIIQPGLPGVRINDDMPPPPPPFLTQRDPRATGDTAWHSGRKHVRVLSSVLVDSSQGAELPMLELDSLLRSMGVTTANRDSVHRIVNVKSITRAFACMNDSSASHFINGDIFVDSALFPQDVMSAEKGAKSIREILSVIRTDSTIGSLRTNLFGGHDSTFIRMHPGFGDSTRLRLPMAIMRRRRTPTSSDSVGASFEHFYRSQSGDTTQWSSLIPIRVTNYNTPEHHTLIFWYERTPEVMNIVPKSAVEKADARPKNIELSVYPNPTSGETNVHYVVKNGEPVTINVVSLLGQKLIEGAARQDQHGDLSLDLSSLEPGVYLLIATLQSGEKAVERVVVTK